MSSGRPSNAALVLLKGFLGDAVLTTPFLDSLQVSFSKVFVVTSCPVIDVLEDTYPSVQFIPSRKLSNPIELMRQAAEIGALNVEQAFIVNRSFRSALCAKLAKIPRRFGHDTDNRSVLLTKAIRYDAEREESECYLDLVRAASLPTVEVKPHLAVSEELRQRGRAMLDAAAVGVQPGARYAKKQWPIEEMARFVDAIAREGHRVCMLGGPDEREAAHELASKVAAPLVDLVGKCSLKETLGVLSALRLAVGSDTGLMHLAAGVGCPTVTVFGPNPTSKWGHLYPPHRVIQAPKGDMKRVSANEVLDAAEAALIRL